MQLGKMLSKEASNGPWQVRYIANRHVQWDRVVLDDLDTMSFNQAEREKFDLRAGDLLVCEGGEVGRTALWRGETTGVFFQKAVHRLRPLNGRVEPGYMLRFMRRAADTGAFTDLSSQTSIAHLTREKLALLSVPTPPVHEQRQIAAIVDTIDDAIRKTEQIIAKLKQVKQSLLHDLLTRGIDDNGELRDPKRHPEQFKGSPLGQIPRGWEVADLASIAEVRSGIAKNSNRAVRDAVSVHYLRVANVQDGFLDLAEMSTILLAKDDVGRYRVLPGDVLMNEGGDRDKLGRGSLWQGEFEPCVHQNHVFVVRCGPRMAPEFLNAWTGSTTARRYFMIAGKQTTNLASINKTALGRLPVVIPPKADQTAAVALLAAAQHRMAAEQALLGKLRLMKAGLMEDLLTGRVRVTKLLESAAE